MRPTGRRGSAELSYRLVTLDPEVKWFQSFLLGSRRIYISAIKESTLGKYDDEGGRY